MNSYSVDGFGDSDDIALERSRSEDSKTQNYYDSFHERPEDAEYSASGIGMKVKDIFISMLRNNSMVALYYKDQVAPYGDLHEEFADAWGALITELELDEEESYNPSVLDMGHQIEFCLI
jgi:hypothetical protein